MEVLEKELELICRIIEQSKILRIVIKRAFIRTDGKPMLYVKAKSPSYYIHVEGMKLGKKLNCYVKLTKSERNTHSHKDEIMGWDNLYNARPHIHFNKDEKREYRDEEISWDEIINTIKKLEVAK